MRDDIGAPFSGRLPEAACAAIAQLTAASADRNGPTDIVAPRAQKDICRLVADPLVKNTDKGRRQSDGGALYPLVKRGWKGRAFISRMF